MRIIVWGINYGEKTGIGPYNTALCEYLQARGHDVEMVSSFQYYPAWRKRPEDRGVLFRTEKLHGVTIRRCWHYVPARVSSWKRIIHEGTFVATSLVRLLTLRRPDVMVVVSPPLLLGAAAWLASSLKRTKFLFHVQDLQPDAALDLGMLKATWFTRLLYRLERFAYQSAWRVSGISEGMLTAFRAKGVPEEKLVLFPNSVTLKDPLERGHFRKKHGFEPDDFLAIYSGNIGTKQGLQVLIEAAKCIVDPRIKIVVCGDGAQRQAIENQAAGLANIRFLNLLPESEYHEMLTDTNVSVITQLAGAGATFFPSKLLNALCFGKPVLAVADDQSELTRVLRDSGCGISVLPGDPEALAAALMCLLQDPGLLEKAGQAGREYVAQFDAQRIFPSFEKVLLEV